MSGESGEHVQPSMQNLRRGGRRIAARVGAAVFGLAAAAAATGAADAVELPPGANRDLVAGVCGACHDVQYLVESAGIGRDAWSSVINGMRQFGLKLQPAERAKILDYLATYLGPTPPAPALAVSTAEAASVSGAKVFADTCAACHQADGKGVPGAFPPLAGNHDLFLAPLFPATVVLHGLQGPIKVNGKAFDNTMPAFVSLSDAQIAAVVNYVRSSWGNKTLRPAGFAPVTSAEVAAIRAKPMSPSDVHAYRGSLR